MSINLTLESLEGLEEPLSALYEERDGKYHLKLEGGDDMRRAKENEAKAHKATKEALAASKQAAKEAQDALAAIQSEAEKQAADQSREKGDVVALEKSWRQKYEKDLSEAKEKADAQGDLYRTNINRLLIDNEANRIAAELAIKGSEQVITPHIKSRLAVEERDGTFITVVKDSEGNVSALTTDDLKKEISSNPGFAPVLLGSKASGGGADGSKPSGGVALKRSEMNSKAKAEYISEHGQDNFLKLPK